MKPGRKAKTLKSESVAQAPTKAKPGHRAGHNRSQARIARAAIINFSVRVKVPFFFKASLVSDLALSGRLLSAGGAPRSICCRSRALRPLVAGHYRPMP